MGAMWLCSDCTNRWLAIYILSGFLCSDQLNVEERDERYEKAEGGREKGIHLMEISDCARKSHICTRKLKITSTLVWNPISSHL